MRYHVEFDIDFKRNKSDGLFIAIEGNEGAGKTTQVKLLCDELRKKYKVYKTKNPTDSEIGVLIRKVLAGQVNVPPVSFQYLFSSDRQVHQVNVLKHLKKGEIVVTDRYFWSALVYGIVDREDLDFEKSGNLLLTSLSILSMYHQFIVPDLTIYLEVPVETALERINKTRKSLEIYENKEKLMKIQKGYKWLLNKFPNEITRIDGSKSVSEVTKQTLDKIYKLKIHDCEK
jgi:dTMP kinase